MRKEKWLLFSHSSELAGAELSMLPILSSGSKRKIEIDICLPGKGPLEENIRQIGDYKIIYFKNTAWITGHWPRLSGPIRLIKILLDIPKLKRLIQLGNYDFVLVNTSLMPGPLFGSFKASIPAGMIVHECIKTNPELKSFLPKTWIIKLLKRYSLPLVAVSHFVAEQLGGVIVSYPDIGSKSISTQNSQQKILQANLLRTVMVGRISKQKGQFDAINQIIDLQKRGFNVTLDLFGPADITEKKALLDLIDMNSASSYVRYHGPTADAQSTIKKFDLSLVLSRHESYGRVTVESILAGVPVLGYSIEGTKEILQYGGGILVSPDTKELSQTLEKLFNDSRLLSDLQQQCLELAKKGEFIGSADDTISLLQTFSLYAK